MKEIENTLEKKRKLRQVGPKEYKRNMKKKRKRGKSEVKFNKERTTKKETLRKIIVAYK